MSFVQTSIAPEQRAPFGGEPARSPLDPGLILGLGLLGLGIGMLCLGLFHGFAHGSCSTTGYSRNYGPVQHCSKGIGWWMLMLMAGLLVAGVGAALARSVSALMIPLVFVAIGAPFIALALGDHGHLLFNSSSSSGKLFAGVFGGCFVTAGLIWGVFAARNVKGLSGGSVIVGLLAAVVGVGAAFAIAAGASSAIGKTTAPSSVQIAPGVTVLSAAAEKARQISLCKNVIAGQRLISARDRALLSTECKTNWKAAEHRVPAAARRGALAYAAAQCKQQGRRLGSATGLSASAGSSLATALAAACGNPSSSQSGTGLKSLQAQLCQQIVKAQVPAAAQRKALAACPKP